MKGAELPINIIIVFILALAVLIAMIAVFMGVWTPGSAGLGQESAKNSGCQKYVGLQLCDDKTDKGDTINIETVTCKCSKADIGSGTTTTDESIDVNTLEHLAKCCYGRTDETTSPTAAAKLCC